LLLLGASVLGTGVGPKSQENAASYLAVRRPATPPVHHFYYPFIHKDKNVIIRKGDEPLEYFYQSLDSLTGSTRRKVNIVHIGDSHVQADMFPGKLRESFHLDPALGNGGRGLTFPYRAVGTNSPINLKVSYAGTWTGCRNIARTQTCEWGLTGITATTQDPDATFTINPNLNASVGLTYPVTRIKVFYDVHNASQFTVNLLNEGVVATRHVDPRGFVEFQLETAVEEVHIGLQKSGPDQLAFTLQGITLENDQPGVQYHSVGINGAEVGSFLRSPHLEAQLAVLQPDLVIVSLGTNDAFPTAFDPVAFKRGYGTLIQRIRRAAPRASLLLTAPGDCYRGRKYPNLNNAKATRQLLELAEETGSGAWNFYEVMGGLRSIGKWYASGLAAADKVHLTRKGYELQGTLLYEALINDYYAYSGGHKVHMSEAIKKGGPGQ
jgi:lysophospholipase L1-like esterase